MPAWRKSTSPTHRSTEKKAVGVGPAGGGPYFTLDYDEAISSVTEKLKVKHEEIDAILSEVEELASNKGKVKVAISLLSAISPLILRSAVEEEARIMRGSCRGIRALRRIQSRSLESTGP